MADRKQRKRQEGAREKIPLRTCPMTYILQLDPPPKVSTNPQYSATSWGPSVQHMNLWGYLIFKA
jgi:hypothetical protein